MAGTADTLIATLSAALGDKIKSVTAALGEVTAIVAAEHLTAVFTGLRDRRELRFDQLIDICGVDYRDYAGGNWEGPRFVRCPTTGCFVCARSRRMTRFPCSRASSISGRLQTGSNARRSICTASCSRAIPICADS